MDNDRNKCFDFENIPYVDMSVNINRDSTGTVRMKKPFMIRGKIKGHIESESDLVVDTNAVVDADINAERVLIRGRVKGNVRANKLIFVTASGTLIGDITSQKIVLEPGSEFTGKCTMVK